MPTSETACLALADARPPVRQQGSVRRGTDWRRPPPINGPFVTDLQNILTKIGGVTLTKVPGKDYGTFVLNDSPPPPQLYVQDRWVQDEIEIGFNKSPKSEMHSVFDGPRDDGLNGYAKNKLLTKNTAAFSIPPVVLPTPPETDGFDLNSFGNLEVTPRLTAGGKDWLLGRIYYGAKAGDRVPLRKLIEFLQAQEVQGPVALDSAWLWVGHVDEFISFVPFPSAAGADKKFKVLLASPKRAVEILAQESKNGRGGEFILKLGQTVDQVITAYKAANNDNWQPKIDAVKAVMKTRFGLVDADFIDIPVLFRTEHDDGGKPRALAYIPDMVNLLVVNGQLIVPEPFYDPFKKDFEDKLAAIGYVKSGAANSKIHFLDDYIWYHKHEGEVHCGTNSRRKIPATPNWWEQR